MQIYVFKKCIFFKSVFLKKLELKYNLHMLQVCDAVSFLNHLPTSAVCCWYSLQTVWKQIRLDKKSGLIWIQTAWHYDCIPERIFLKKFILIETGRRQKSMVHFPVGKELILILKVFIALDKVFPSPPHKNNEPSSRVCTGLTWI